MSVAPLSWRFLIFEFLFILLRPSLLYTTVLHPSSQAELFILRGSEVVHAKPHVSRKSTDNFPEMFFSKWGRTSGSAAAFTCGPLCGTQLMLPSSILGALGVAFRIVFAMGAFSVKWEFKEALSHLDGCASRNKRACTEFCSLHPIPACTYKTWENIWFMLICFFVYFKY